MKFKINWRPSRKHWLVRDEGTDELIATPSVVHIQVPSVLKDDGTGSAWVFAEGLLIEDGDDAEIINESISR